MEIGPGHVPFPVPDRITVRYIDRWEPSENSSLFPELGESPGFPPPDIVSDLDNHRLGGLGDESQDFVIASHVIEHLANPLAMLAEIHRVLRTGGLLILLVPDRHRTFDRNRNPTPLAHLVDEYERDVREVDDADVTEYLIATRQVTEGVDPSPDDLTADNIAIHRRRSIHAHVWDEDEFQQVLQYGPTRSSCTGRWSTPCPRAYEVAMETSSAGSLRGGLVPTGRPWLWLSSRMRGRRSRW